MKSVFRKLNCCLVLLLLFACDDALYKKTVKNFEQNRWYQTAPLEFEFDVEDIEATYDLTMHFSYVYGSQFSEIPIEVYITDPTHQIDKIPYDLKLRDEHGNELGDCAGDVCDLAVYIKERYTFKEKGAYKIQVLNKFNNEYLPNVLAIGFRVMDTKKK